MGHLGLFEAYFPSTPQTSPTCSNHAIFDALPSVYGTVRQRKKKKQNTEERKGGNQDAEGTSSKDKGLNQ